MCGKMEFKSSSLLYLALFLAISSSIHAFNITELLADKPDYANFNKYLNETKLVDQINRRNTITVLALSNDAISTISGKTPEVTKAIMSTHVLLDYFDIKKLRQVIIGKGRPLTTLYQASGLAVNNQGFLKAAVTGDGSIAFGSAVSGAPKPYSKIVHIVVSQPYNISILEVSSLIVAPGIDSQSPPPPEERAKAPSGAESPSSDEVIPPSPPEDVSPAEAPTPDASSPSSAPAPGPGDEDAADAETHPSSSSRIIVGLVEAVMCFASLLVVM